MMEESKVKSRANPSRKVTRIALDDEALRCLSDWEKQVKELGQGVSLNSKKLVNWAIVHIGETLSGPQRKEIYNLHYDEVKFILNAAKELQMARSSGNDLKLSDILKRQKTATTKSKSHGKIPKKKPVFSEGKEPKKATNIVEV